MGKKLTITQLKKELLKWPYKELIDLICKLYKSSTEVSDQINLILDNDSFVEDTLEETKRKIKNQFFPKKNLQRPNLTTAKSTIIAFKKICSDPEKIIDLQLFYVECGVEFTKKYGDIYENFYISMAKMYETAIKSLIKIKNASLTEKSMPRFKKIANDAQTIGWGFYTLWYALL